MTKSKYYKYPILWFDLDNTLLSFKNSSFEAFSALLKEIGLEEKEDSYEVFHKINKVEWRLFEDGKITQDQLKHSRFQNYFDHIGFDFDGLTANGIYLKHIVQFPYYVEGAQELLKTLQEQKYKMSIITNGMKEVQRPRIKLCNWDHYFDQIFVSDEIGLAKPNVEFFNYCLEKSGHPDKSEILVIGDTLESDILGAKNANIKSCWINPNGDYCPPDLKPDYEINKLAELYEIV